jgi:hypothetical protein
MTILSPRSPRTLLALLPFLPLLPTASASIYRTDQIEQFHSLRQRRDGERAEKRGKSRRIAAMMREAKYSCTLDRAA